MRTREDIQREEKTSKCLRLCQLGYIVFAVAACLIFIVQTVILANADANLVNAKKRAILTFGYIFLATFISLGLPNVYMYRQQRK